LVKLIVAKSIILIEKRKVLTRMQAQLSSNKLIFWTIISVSIALVAITYNVSVSYQVRDRWVRATAMAIPTATAEALELRYQKAVGNVNLGRWEAAKTDLDFIFEIDPNYKDIQTQLGKVETTIIELRSIATPAPSSPGKPDHCNEIPEERTFEGASTVEHIIKFRIPKEIVGTASWGGYTSFDNQKFAGVNPGDRLIICVEFPDQLVVKDSPRSINVSIGGGRDVDDSVSGVEPMVESEGTLKLRWFSEGLRGSASDGTIHGFWMSFSAANTPQDGQSLNFVKASFTVPLTINSNPIQKNQDINISNVSWSNLSSPSK
jgi:hypothetical protein